MIILEIPDPQITVFDFIGRINKHLNGQHFCSLAMTDTGRFFKEGVTIKVTNYSPESEIGPIRMANNGLTFFEAPARVEHFLQAIRDVFPGKGFQELTISYIPYICVSQAPTAITPSS